MQYKQSATYITCRDCTILKHVHLPYATRHTVNTDTVIGVFVFKYRSSYGRWCSIDKVLHHTSWLHSTRTHSPPLCNSIQHSNRHSLCCRCVLIEVQLGGWCGIDKALHHTPSLHSIRTHSPPLCNSVRHNVCCRCVLTQVQLGGWCGTHNMLHHTPLLHSIKTHSPPLCNSIHH